MKRSTKIGLLFSAAFVAGLLVFAVIAMLATPVAAKGLADQPISLGVDESDSGFAEAPDDDPQLNVEIGPGNTYVRFVNSQLDVRYEPYIGSVITHEEFVIRDFIYAGVNMGSAFLDANSSRSSLLDATIVYSDTDRITVRMEWAYWDSVAGLPDPSRPIIQEVSIFPNEPFLKIVYLDVEFGNNIVDLGRPGGTNNGTHVAYGGSSWIRGYVTRPDSYYNRYPPDGINDPANGGSLNYGGNFIVGVYRSSTGVGYGRVMPVLDTNIIKLLLTDTERRGLEFFHYGNDGPFTGYLYAVDGGASEIVSYGQQLVDGVFSELDPDAFQSDDFKACSLDTSLWEPLDPLGDGTIVVSGTHVNLSVPAGATHSIWGTGPGDFANNAVRIMQPLSAPDVDFGIEVKFDSGVSIQFQTQGILVEQDNNDVLRFEFHGNNPDTRIFAGRIVNGQGFSEGIATIGGGNIAPLYMRVIRSGNSWTQSYSTDGTNWTTHATFSHAMNVTKVGVYAGNETTGTPNQDEPAHTAVVDYFFNTASPIDPEDGDTNVLTVDVVGDGSVVKNPDLADYACFEDVSLTANADPGWTFQAWSGDLSGSTNPETINITGDHVVTATFTQEAYTLDVNVVGSGAVALDPDQASYNLNDVVTMTATADPGWAFAGWSGDATGLENPETITITANTAVTATFTQEEYTLLVNTIGQGSVTVEPDQPTFTYNEVVTLTAVPAFDWVFFNWSGDALGTENPKTITIQGNTVITATFAESGIYRLFLPLIRKDP